jgi:uncharacterized iron-regulated membrane protein
MRTRRFIAKVHGLLGLAFGLLFVLATGSGALLIFRHEIDRALNPHLFRATPGREVGFDPACAAVGRAFAGREVMTISSGAMPAANGVYALRLAREPAIDVFVDPGRGKILGWRRSEDDPLDWVFRFHTRFLGGKVGSCLVGMVGIGLLAMIGTGCRLWWPGRKKLALGFTIRRGRGRALLHYDLHRVVGLVAAPLLTLIVVTGVLLTFDAFADRLIYGLSFAVPEPSLPRDMATSRPGGIGRLSPDTLRRIAEDVVPDATTISMKWPQRSGRPVQVRLKAPEGRHPNGRSFVLLDPYTGRVLWARDERRLSSAGRLRWIWLYPLHIGTYGGGPSRAVHLLVGLLPLPMLATGLVIWRRHARSRRAARERVGVAMGGAGRRPD